MTEQDNGRDVGIDGPASLSRTNGERLFQEPWEARAFGIVMALCETGVFEWQEFQHRLISKTTHWEASTSSDAEYKYYERWLDALQELLKDKELCTNTDVEDRTEEVSLRQPGHDHS